MVMHPEGKKICTKIGNCFHILSWKIFDMKMKCVIQPISNYHYLRDSHVMTALENATVILALIWIHEIH